MVQCQHATGARVTINGRDAVNLSPTEQSLIAARTFKLLFSLSLSEYLWLWASGTGV